jgi:hypothetical protein
MVKKEVFGLPARTILDLLCGRLGLYLPGPG